MRGDPLAGVSRSLISGHWDWPVHGVRYPPDGQFSGWYVWTGERSDADDFYQPWHLSHVVDRCPAVERLLDLPAGSRFLIAPGHEDVWDDPALLDA